MTDYYTYRRSHVTVIINPSSLKDIKTGRIITFSGASCSGKTTLAEILGKSEGYRTVGKVTSRGPRDANSKELCVDPDTVEAIRQTGDFVYWMAYDGAHYVLSASSVADCLVKGQTVLVDTPTMAAIGLKEHLPDRVTTVFVDVPDREKTLTERMMKRGDSNTTIEKRICHVPLVYAARDKFDIVVLNPNAPPGEPLPAVQTLHSMFEAASLR